MKRKTKTNIKRFTITIIGSAMMAVGAYFFLFAVQVASGGVGGLSLIINFLFPSIPIGIMTAILNIFLFIIGFMVLGREFGIFTIAGTAAYSLTLIAFDIFFKNPDPVLHDPLMNILTASAINGVGLSMVFSQNASTGGTDIIAKILDKYFSIGMGTAIMFADAFVIILAIFTLGIEKAIYGILSLVITSMVIDKILTGFNTMIKMTIISDNIETINEFIFSMNRGTTIYKAIGGYTKKDRDILVTIVSRTQYVKIKNFINRIDEKAFVFVNTTSDVIGEGFTREQVKND